MANWTSEGKTDRQIKRRNDIVTRMNGVESGWEFVRYETFPEDQTSYCQVSGYPMKHGVRVRNPGNGNEFVVSERIALEYVDDVVLPRKTETNVVLAEPTILIPLPKEPTTRKRGRPPKSVEQREAERIRIVEPGLSAKYAADPSLYIWRPTKL